jgi:hypothetical protein
VARNAQSTMNSLGTRTIQTVTCCLKGLDGRRVHRSTSRMSPNDFRLARDDPSCLLQTANASPGRHDHTAALIIIKNWNSRHPSHCNALRNKASFIRSAASPKLHASLAMGSVRVYFTVQPELVVLRGSMVELDGCCWSLSLSWWSTRSSSSRMGMLRPIS